MPINIEGPVQQSPFWQLIALLTMELQGTLFQRLSVYLSYRTSVFGKCASSLLAVLPSPTLPKGTNPTLSLEPTMTFPEGDARQDNSNAYQLLPLDVQV